MTKRAPFEERRSAHQASEQKHREEVRRARALENRISVARLVTFLVGAGALTSALAIGGTIAAGLAVTGACAFVGAVAYQSKVSERRARASARADVHARHLARMRGEAPGHEASDLLDAEHAYARDVDLLGRAGLVARLDVTHTRRGTRRLVDLLAAADDVDAAQKRQTAVRELATATPWRCEFEVAAAAHDGSWTRDLDDAPFLRVTTLPSLFDAHRWLLPAVFVLPALTLGGIVAARLGQSQLAWILPLAVQLALLRWSRGAVDRGLGWMTARLQFGQAFQQLLRHVEGSTFDSPWMREARAQLQVDGIPASEHMQGLARVEGWAQLRTQGPVYLVVNALTLWDLFCLWRLEAFNRRVGPHCERWFEVLGEVEALSSLATLADVDPHTCYPELAHDGPLAFDALVHPLLPPDSRVDNDVRLAGPRSVWVITGSNMAGKSTLLRSVGLSIALALAGGPVVARRARVPKLRLRASMRVDDSLQRGASYFRAELTKLQGVVESLDRAPPVFFLLDEVLRGTNSRARSVGARAVVRHLVHHGALGLVATHDAGLATLEDEADIDAANCHFTDVFEHGEMRFDYRLRPGVVQSSNALRLLQMAGIEVQDQDLAPEHEA